MANPLFGNPEPRNPIQNIMQMRNQITQLKQNPQEIADLLKNSGRINDEQLKAIQGMNSPSQIGQYLMNSIPQNMRAQIQNSVEEIQRRMN